MGKYRIPRAARVGVAASSFLGLLIAVGACSSPTAPTTGSEPIQTERSEYSLDVEGAWMRTDIQYTFANRTGGPVYLVNCNGGFDLRLERWSGSRWETAWSPILFRCLSRPIVIDEGVTVTDTLRVTAGLPGTNAAPKFDKPKPTGTYRIVWTSALSTYDQDARPFGSEIPLEHRISNPFRLEVE